MKRNYIAPNIRSIELGSEKNYLLTMSDSPAEQQYDMDVKEEFQNVSFDSKSIWDREW